MLAALFLLPAGTALADSCEDSYQKKGNPFTGTVYTASVNVPNLSIASAMGQLRGVAVKNKLSILADDEGGSMLAEEPETMTHKPIPITFSASEGRVDMSVKLNRGAFGAGADAMKKYMCDMLADIKPGKAGMSKAQAAQSAGATVTEISAVRLASQVKNQAKDNEGAINARYKGKAFRVNGFVSQVVEDDGRYTLIFKSFDTSELFPVPIKCIIASNQAAYALSVREGEKATLTGTFDQYDRTLDHFYLKDCRP